MAVKYNNTPLKTTHCENMSLAIAANFKIYIKESLEFINTICHAYTLDQYNE